MSYVPIVIDAGMLQQQPVGETLTPVGDLDVVEYKILSSTADLILQPAAEKALRADSAGNTRGKYAVDLQQLRTNVAFVAAGDYSVIGGGYDNSVAGDYGTVCGGYDNNVTHDYGTIAGGTESDVLHTYGTVGGGYSHTVEGQYGTINGGYTNSVANLCGTVGGGATNAVTGDYATISGGRVNDITANYGTVGGGYDNNVTAIDGTVCGGRENDISGLYGTVGGGLRNDVESEGGAIGGGADNTVTGDYGAISGGSFNEVSGDYGSASGYYAKADKYGQHAAAGGKIAALGDAQVSQYILRNSTTDANSVVLYLDGTSAILTIPTDTTWAFDIVVVARRTDSDGESARYEYSGCIDNNAGTTALVGAVQNIATDIEDSDWTVTVTADNTGDALRLQVVGEEDKTIYWVAVVRTVEVTG